MSTDTRLVELSLNDDGTKLWINIDGHNRARFSTISGYEVYTSDGYVDSFGTEGTEETFLIFAKAVKRLHNIELDASDIEFYVGVNGNKL